MIDGYDRRVSASCHQFALGHPLLLETAHLVAVLGHPWVWRAAVTAAAVTLWRRARRRTDTAGTLARRRAVIAVATMATGSLTGAALKVLVARPRPPWAQTTVTATGMSMPSGHALNATLGVWLLLMLAWPRLSPTRRRLAVLAAVIVVCVIGLDRLLLGVHYPSDVLAGTGLGIGFAALACAAGRPGRPPAQPDSTHDRDATA